MNDKPANGAGEQSRLITRSERLVNYTIVYLSVYVVCTGLRYLDPPYFVEVGRWATFVYPVFFAGALVIEVVWMLGYRKPAFTTQSLVTSLILGAVIRFLRSLVFFPDAWPPDQP